MATDARSPHARCKGLESPRGNFKVDGWSSCGCDAVAVDTTTGVAECETTFPSMRGSHTATAAYSGYNGLPAAFDRSDDEEEFTVYAGVPAVTPSPTVAYWRGRAGQRARRDR